MSRETESDRWLALALSGGGISPQLAFEFITITRNQKPVQSNHAQAAMQASEENKSDEED